MSALEPTAFWADSENLVVDEPVWPGHPLWVDTQAARGEFCFDPIMIRLGIDPESDELGITRRGPQYMLFAGHLGCGKSTELNNLIGRIGDRYLTVKLDSSLELDSNDLQYVDVLLLAAEKLSKRLQEEDIRIDRIHLDKLRRWFAEQTTTATAFGGLEGEIGTEVKAGFGLPQIFTAFAKLRTAVRASTSYQKEIRVTMRNTFTDFVEAFNGLITAAEEKLERNGVPRRILFVVDGTDRLQGEDTKRFFVDDVNQLKQVKSNFIYCARIDTIYDNRQLEQRFAVTVVPMIKLFDKQGNRVDEAFATMRAFVHKRVRESLFDGPATVDLLIAHSGGHPRDMVRLLEYAFESSVREKRVHRSAAERAVHLLATDYKRKLDPDDYDLLVEIDRHPDEQEQSERMRDLLWNQAALEYNSFWWRSHPVIRTLPGYREAEARRDGRGGGG